MTKRPPKRYGGCFVIDIEMLLDKCQVLLSIRRVDFVKEAPILFLHGIQDGCWFKVGDQQDVASRFQLPEELIDVSQRHFAALE